MTPPVSYAASGDRDTADLSPHLRAFKGRGAPVLEWGEIGVRIALVGALVPLFLLGGFLLTATSHVLLGGTYLSRPLVGVLTFSAVGFPFLLFICFVFSTLATLPIVSGLEWITKRIKVELSPAWVIALGGGLVSTAWTILLAVVYTLVR